MGTSRRVSAASILPGAAWTMRLAAALAAVLLASYAHELARAQARDRSGEQVVAAQCAKCHATGEGGAPRIGDKAAWTPRLSHGLDAAIRSAIAGHGAMPARGGLADLTDLEVRSAIVYMFNPVSAVTVPAQRESVAPRAPGGNRKVVAGVEIDVGVVPAESLRVKSAAEGKDAPMHGSFPGKGYMHVNVSLFDNDTHAPILDADVRATVKDPVMGDQTHQLEAMVINGITSYGNYFRAPGTSPYRIDVQVSRPGARFVDAEFDFRR